MQGLDFIVELSPYDVPKAIVGKYSSDKGMFVISFEYIDEEPMKRVHSEHGVEIFEGKHSGKFMRLVIDVDQPPLDQTAVIQLKTRVLKALDDPSLQTPRGEMNRRVTKELLEEDFADLASDLVGV